MQDLLKFIQQHGTLTLTFGILFVLIILVELIRAKRASQQLTPNEVTTAINHQDASIVDLRATETFATGHIINAISFPYTDFKTKLNKLEKFKSKPIILVCTMGTESTQAAAELTSQGYNVQVLAGGMRAWRLADLPVVKGT